MPTVPTIRKRQNEAGIALLIAIFVLLLIGVAAIALVVSSGTESALAGNYRSSTSVYYAATAGLEEVRARLRPNDPNSFSNIPGFLPAPGTPLNVCAPVYVLNPAGGENITPWDPGNAAYYDSEFGQELGAICGGTPPSPSPTTPSVWNKPPLNGLPFPGPLYKWVRINGVTEKSLNLDVCPYDGLGASLVFYGVVNPPCNPALGLNDQGAGAQVLELTALAALPNGSQKLLQYLVAPQPLSLNLPAALIMAGASPNFSASRSPSFWVRGDDQGAVGNCNPSGAFTSTALGYTDASYAPANFEQPANSQGIPSGPSPAPNLLGNYTNYASTNPNIALVTLSQDFSSVATLNNLVQIIQQNADVVVNGNATQTGGGGPMPSAMSPTNPMTIVINGDLTFNSWRQTGYGLLLVTGKLTYDPDASWDGIILVIGQGYVQAFQGSYTTTQIQGAVLLANTTGLSSNQAPSNPIFDFSGTPPSLTNTIQYSHCWIQAAMPKMPYKILSFHEISQ